MPECKKDDIFAGYSYAMFRFLFVHLEFLVLVHLFFSWRKRGATLRHAIVPEGTFQKFVSETDLVLSKSQACAFSSVHTTQRSCNIVTLMEVET